MTELRELTDAELDTVGGGITNKNQGCGGGIKLVEEILSDILKVFESNSRGCNSRPVKVRAD